MLGGTAINFLAASIKAANRIYHMLKRQDASVADAPAPLTTIRERATTMANLKTIALTAAVAIPLIFSVSAQAQTYTTRPNFGDPNRYGTTTTDDRGNTYTTRPNFGDANRYGTTTTDDRGNTCTTRPNFGDASRYGTTTDCN
jgi:hypothetical protein